MQLLTRETSKGELFDKIIDCLPEMKAHVNITRVQHAAFQNDKKENDIQILQIDFAMSFGCEYQNEVQSALWTRSSVLLFTAALFYKGNCQTYLICSDSKNKDKDTIFVFLEFLYSEIFKCDRNSDRNPKSEIIWSDGPSAEFKNNYMVKTIGYLAEKFRKPFTWKYFATPHGKGVVDGIGGNVKRLVRQKMLSQGDGVIVQCAKDFASLAVQVVKSTQIFYIEESHITSEISDKTPWEDVLPIPGISKFHLIEVNPGGAIICRNQDLSSDTHCFGRSTDFGEGLDEQCNDLAVGHWVLVEYNGVKYPGEIISVEGSNSFKVSVMEESNVKGLFKWLKDIAERVRVDAINYSSQEIIKKISAPVLANS
ncbi:uncharacterized protein LOC134529157 [Bacillus rossius redtenbacheri]|uniref:uncharacterized protein LOC134529157 n=1 Tax=Bacillus rossius redtenbacheri TaxID=93214 RepID=UPI002FDE91E7